MLWKNPEALIISLKRFDFTSTYLKKNNRPIQIPEHIDMSKYTVGKTATRYKLKACATHSGSYMGGHYHAISQDQKDMTWCIFDDESVMKFGEGEVNFPSEHLSKGYTLFYFAE